jgi:phosphatidate cytidylyltransferase
MLLTRVITAVVLLLVLLPALFLLPPLWWEAVVFMALMVAAWEWARLAKLGAVGIIAYVLLSAVVALGLHLLVVQAPRIAYGISFLFWLLLVPLMFKTGFRPQRGAAALTGWCVLFPFAWALIDLRALGPWLLISVMALVWVADIAAYFAGRAFGKRKLAPSISPGKTWAGVGGAFVAVFAYLGGNVAIGNPLFNGTYVWTAAALAGVLLTSVSILGDLFESAMKRAAGVKDSSNLLPGHGGVLDRVDALTAALPVAALLLIWSGKL